MSSDYSPNKEESESPIVLSFFCTRIYQIYFCAYLTTPMCSSFQNQSEKIVDEQ